MTSDPQGLIDLTVSACYQCIPWGSRPEVLLSLLDRISQVGLKPKTPVAAAGSGAVGGGFTANWSTASGASSYRLDVANDAAFTSIVTGFNKLNVGNVTSYNAYGLVNNRTYYYRVYAASAGGTLSDVSNTITISTLQITWFPAAATVTWTDGGGAQGPSNLAAFLLAYNPETLTDIAWSNAVNTISNAGGFPLLNNLTCSSCNALTDAEFYGQTNIGVNAGFSSCTILANCYLNDVTRIGGAFQGGGTTNAGNIFLNSLVQIGSVACLNCGFQVFNAPSLTTSTGAIQITNNSRMTTLVLNKLRTVTTLTIQGNSNAAFTSLNLSSLVSCGNANLNNNPNNSIYLTSLSSLGTAATQMQIGGTSVTLIDAPSLVSALNLSGINVLTCGFVADMNPFPNLTVMGGNLSVTSQGSLTGTLRFPSLTNGVGVSISTCINATSCLLPNLTSLTGSFSINTWAAMTSANFNLTSLKTVGINMNVTTCANAGFTALNFPALTTVGGNLSFNGCTNATSFTTNGLLPANLKTHTWNNCSLTQANVDAILCAAATSMVTAGGSVNVAGGANSPPGAAGAACVITLSGVPVTVTTN